MSEKKKSWLHNSIWLITLVPLVIAWSMAFTGIGVPGSTKNKGELMPMGLTVPKNIINAQQGHWGIIVVSDTCEYTLSSIPFHNDVAHLFTGRDLLGDSKGDAYQYSACSDDSSWCGAVDPSDSSKTLRCTSNCSSVSFCRSIQFNNTPSFFISSCFC